MDQSQLMEAVVYPLSERSHFFSQFETLKVICEEHRKNNKKGRQVSEFVWENCARTRLTSRNGVIYFTLCSRIL